MNYCCYHIMVCVKHFEPPPPPRDCMSLALVVGLVWSNESWSYACGSVATGSASHARLVRDEDPVQEAIHSFLQDCWWLDARLTTCSGKHCCEN